MTRIPNINDSKILYAIIVEFFFKRINFVLVLVLHYILKTFGVSVAEWLRSLTSNCLPLTDVGSNATRDFGFFYVR